MDKKKLRIYRKVLWGLLGFNIVLFVGYSYIYMEKIIPDDIHIIVNEEGYFSFSMPLEGVLERDSVDAVKIIEADHTKEDIHFSMQKEFVLSSEVTGDYAANLKIFGIIPYKSMKIHVVEGKRVQPSGKTVGLYVQSDGILVLGTGRIKGADGREHEPAQNIIQSGDYIIKVQDKKATNIESMMQLINEEGGGKIKLTVKRDEEELELKVPSVLAEDNVYRVGIWVREDTEGIGTMTYVDESNQFGALGHGITDYDTGALFTEKKGAVYDAEIMEVVKGSAGAPGELVGIVDLGEKYKLGNIISNSPLGIFGEIKDEDFFYSEEDSMPIGLKQEVKEGDALIRCQLGNEIKDYEIEIEEVALNSTDNKGMVIRVTDKELIRETGGIVQGMSGAPIIQNGKCIGAVTHVLVKDATLGYGTFIENMLLAQ